MEKHIIKIETQVEASLQKTWDYWTNPKHIMNWNNASEDWHTPKAENDLRVGGKFLSRMEAKDGSFGFDFWGVYDERIAYTMCDGRTAKINFKKNGTSTTVEEHFEAETENSLELQLTGWQAILNNFKKYTESH
jgi:uncharacterized protein YndB with AHSA1/START domain